MSGENNQSNNTDNEFDALKDEVSALVSGGKINTDHQFALIDSTKAASDKIDGLRSFLDGQFGKGWIPSIEHHAPEVAHKTVLDAVAGCLLHISRISSLLPSLTDLGQETAVKLITFILNKLKAVLDDFGKHLQYQNWSISLSGGLPFSLQAGITITFQ